ncbi:MAG: type II toxin-antitoxin system VapC family toxin [Dehalococcoidia bacterium]
MIEPDINVLINAFREDAPGFVRYREWLLDVARGPEEFGLSDLVLSGFLRIVTSRATSSLDYDPAIALSFVEALRSRPNCVHVRPGPRQWELFTSLCRQTGARGKLIPDAYHAATAIEHGHDWISDDADFGRFPGLRWRRPFD